jgi:hypothetical protein
LSYICSLRVLIIVRLPPEKYISWSENFSHSCRHSCNLPRPGRYYLK